jgi:hypothetical protein
MAPTKFTLRLEHDSTRELLDLLAERWGMSVNRTIEQLLERELFLAAEVEAEALAETVALLQSYRPTPDRLERTIEAIADAEVDGRDPVEGRARSLQHAPLDDPLGVAAMFR